MPDKLSFLPYFLTEDIFLLPEDRQKRALSAGTATAAPATGGSSPATPPEEKKVPVKPAPVAEAKPAAASPQAQQSTAKEAANPKLVFGKNHKHLLILVEDPASPVMERADGLFLKDILKAIQYTFDDVAIVNIAHCRTQADWEYINTLPFSHLFSFGVSHPQLPATRALAPYELEGSGDRQFLLADTLAVLRTERSRKIALWNLLKQMFV